MSDIVRISADAHIHFYASYRLDFAFNRLLANLDRNAIATWLRDPEDTVRLAFLSERADCNFFAGLRNGSVDPWDAGLEILEPQEETCLPLLHRGSRKLFLFAGRQIATLERLEILGLLMNTVVPDGLPARETITRVTEAGGVPVIPWAPGKWLGKRGKLVKKLANQEDIFLADSSLRPRGWPQTPLLRSARASIRPVLYGSDPLPLADEEKHLGRYGFTAEAPFDINQPTAAARALLSEHRHCIHPAGRRRSLLEVSLALRQLAGAQKKI